MQFDTSALFAIGAGVGVILSILCPGHTIAPFLHFLNKGFLVRTALHGFADVIHQLKLPAITANGRPVFSCADLRAALLVGLECREAAGGAELVAELPQMEQGIRVLAQFQAVLETDGVDHKVGMDVVGITMGSYQHFVPRPGLLCKFQSQLVSLLMGDVFMWREGLHILVKADAILFTPCGLGSFKLCDGILSITVDTAAPTDACFLIPSLLFLHAVFHDPMHIAGALTGLFDISDRCQLNHLAQCAGLPHKWHAAE